MANENLSDAKATASSAIESSSLPIRVLAMTLLAYRQALMVCGAISKTRTYFPKLWDEGGRIKKKISRL